MIMAGNNMTDENKSPEQTLQEEPKAPAPKKKRKKKNSRAVTIVIDVLIVFLIGVMAFSGYQLFTTWKGYQDNKQSQNKVSDIFYAQTSGSQEASQISGGSSSHPTAQEMEAEFTLEPLILQNDDTVGWIRMEDTVIDYVIVQGVDNDQYLRHDFFGDYSVGGTVFLDYENVLGQKLQNLIIYGHRMNDGSMFDALGKLLDEKFYKEHSTFQLLLRNSNASSFLNKLHDLIYKNSLEYAKDRFGITDEAKLNYFLSYASFGIMGMVKEWAGQGMTLPKEKLVAYADDLVDRSVQAVF